MIDNGTEQREKRCEDTLEEKSVFGFIIAILFAIVSPWLAYELYSHGDMLDSAFFLVFGIVIWTVIVLSIHESFKRRKVIGGE